jgi:hypothetical protein
VSSLSILRSSTKEINDTKTRRGNNKKRYSGFPSVGITTPDDLAPSENPKNHFKNPANKPSEQAKPII